MRKAKLLVLLGALCLVAVLAACEYDAQPTPQLGIASDQNEVSQYPVDVPLVFNHLVSTGQVSFSPADWPYAFYHDLSYEQYVAAFSALNLNLRARANYAEDSTLIDVSARSRDDPRQIHIQIAVDERSIGHTMLHDFESPGGGWRDMEQSQVQGVTVTARIIDEQFAFSDLSEGEMFFEALFNLHGFRHHVCFNSTLDDGKVLMYDIVSGIILNGIEWIEDLREPIITEADFIDAWLSPDDALLDPAFGAYFPQAVPDGFNFLISRRVMNHEDNYLTAVWRIPRDYEYLYGLYRQWIDSRGLDVGVVWPFDEVSWPDATSIRVFIEAETVVRERPPVLPMEELTLEAVQRHQQVGHGWRQVMDPRFDGDNVQIEFERSHLNIAVRIGNVVVVVYAGGIGAGVSPEDVYALLNSIEMMNRE